MTGPLIGFVMLGAVEGDVTAGKGLVATRVGATGVEATGADAIGANGVNGPVIPDGAAG